VRFSKCNFQCKGFNNPEKLDTTSVEVLGFQPRDYEDIFTIPLITRGCDSIYSWDEKFSHMWNKGTEVDIVNQLKQVLPNGSFVGPSGKRTILSLTGGEPTLRMKFLPALLNHPEMVDCRHILIETNCAVPLKREHVLELVDWARATDYKPVGRITWSNSPKLSVSGELWEDAIRPEIAMMQRTVTEYQDVLFDQYFKFVCGADDSDYEEVAKAMQAYYDAGIPKDVPVYIMPVACLEEQQQAIAAKVAKQCIQRGYVYCHRVQNSVYGNGVGT
jgi:organic radical activating enzyme